MNTFRFGTVLAIALLIESGTACSQTQARGGLTEGHHGPSLFVAQLAAGKVVPSSTSSATGTGAFVFDPSRRTVTYELTFHGLEHGAPRNIALYNFSKGARGSMVQPVCGSGYPACPASPSGNLTGTWSGEGGRPLDGKMIGELISSRIYVEIVGGDGKPEVRSQLEPNGAMVPVHSFAAHLAPMAGTGSRGVGTAVLHEVHLPGGRVSVFYQVTVTGTSGPPRNAAVTGEISPGGSPAASSRDQRVLPKPRLLPSRAAGKGGTLTGDYETNRDQANGVLATRLSAAGDRVIAIVVATDGFPDGELAGVLKPVR